MKKEVVVKEEVPNGEPKRHDNGATRRVLESDSDSDSDIPIMMRKKLKTEDLPSLRHGSLGPGGHPSFFDAKPSQANRPTPANRPVRSVVKNQRNGKKRPAVKPLIERKQVKKEIVKEKDVKMEDVKEDSSEEEKVPPYFLPPFIPQ